MIRAKFKFKRDSFLLDINLSIPSSGITALFGPSGSGKTSLINVLSGIVNPTNGFISIDEKVLFDSEKKIKTPIEQRGLGYVFQDGRLFPHMTVEENLSYSKPRTRSLSNNKKEIVELLGLEHLLTRRPTTLSGGERQRTAVGRAILSSPELLLMDEPLAALDFARKQELLPYLVKLKNNLDIPIIYVSHQLEEVMQLADNVVLLKNGRVSKYGPIDHIINSTELCELMGKDEKFTLLNCKISSSPNGKSLTKLTFDGGHFWVNLNDRSSSSEIRVQLRAQDISIALNKPDNLSIANILDAEIVSIARPNKAYADIKLAVGNSHIWSRVTNSSALRLQLEVGLRVFALIKSTAIQSF